MSNEPIKAIIDATLDEFTESGYMHTNLDLLKAKTSDPDFDLKEHLIKCGISGNRKLLSKSFQQNKDYFERKFALFRSVLRDGYAFMRDLGAFPIRYGQELEWISEYEFESVHPTAEIFAEELEQNPEKRYVDYGAGLRSEVYPNCLYIEVYESATADLVMEPDTPLPLKDQSVDGIGCFAVLEHVRRPWLVAKEFARILKPGGKLFIDWPFLQPVHGYPAHYYNATIEGLRSLFCDDFDITYIGTGAHQTAAFTLNWVLSWYFLGITDASVAQEFDEMKIGDFRKNSNALDRFQSALSPEMNTKLACGNRLVAIKR